MDYSLKNGLALLAVALACARSWEQLLPAIRSRRGAVAPAAFPRASVLSPIAGMAALAYAHAIGADRALLIASWSHTTAALAALLLLSDYFKDEQNEAVSNRPPSTVLDCCLVDRQMSMT